MLGTTDSRCAIAASCCTGFYLVDAFLASKVYLQQRNRAGNAVTNDAVSQALARAIDVDVGSLP